MKCYPKFSFDTDCLSKFSALRVFQKVCALHLQIGSLEVALAALVGSTQFDRRGLQFLLHELKAVRVRTTAIFGQTA